MSTDARGHEVPAGTDDPGQVIAQLEALSLSVRDVVFVANTTERAAAATALSPSATDPLYVHRADAPKGKNLEWTADGSTWEAVSIGGFAVGSVTISSTAADTPNSTTVTFPAGRFSGPPVVMLTANTTVPSTGVTGLGVTGVTASGCTIWCTRANTSSTNVLWLAVG